MNQSTQELSFSGFLTSVGTNISYIMLLATVLAIILFTYLFYRFSKTKARPLPPRPTPWPIIGCLPQMLRAPNPYRWIGEIMADLKTDIACIPIGNVHVIPVTNPKLALEILKEQDAVFASRPKTMASALISHNHLATVLTPYNEQWKKMKKVLTNELFSPARHKWMHAKRLEEADNLVRDVYNQQPIVNLRSVTLRYVSNVINKLVLNKGNVEEEYIMAILNSMRFVFSFGISDIFPILTGLNLDGKEKLSIDANKVITKHHDGIVEERIRKWRHGSSNDMAEEDLLDIMITLKDLNGMPLLSPEEIKAQVTELVIGANTPSMTAEWAMAEMLRQPKVMQRAMQELDEVVGKERLVQESDIPQLTYIKACLMDALRLNPVQPFMLPHYATEDTQLGGYFIPKGSHILISRYAIGRNENVWENPLAFDPERHLKSGADLASSLTDHLMHKLVTFGIGRRSCVAGNLGTVMAVTLLGRLLQAFNWIIPPEYATVDSSKSKEELFLANPLIAQATPRLSSKLYDFKNED